MAFSKALEQEEMKKKNGDVLAKSLFIGGLFRGLRSIKSDWGHTDRCSLFTFAVVTRWSVVMVVHGAF